MSETCRCGHGWEYHGPEVPGCCECGCPMLHALPAPEATAPTPGEVGLTNAGPWEHHDGSPCPHYVASQPRPDDDSWWWCTEHQQYVRVVGLRRSNDLRDRDALISYLEVRLTRAERETDAAEAREAELRATVERVEAWLDAQRDSMGGRFQLVRADGLRVALTTPPSA